MTLSSDPFAMIFRRDFLSVSTPSIHIVLERSPSRSPALGRASHGDTKTRRKVLGRNADVLVGIIASLRFQVSGFSIFRRPSCMPDSNASLPFMIPAWISRSLGSLRWGFSMQGSDLRFNNTTSRPSLAARRKTAPAAHCAQASQTTKYQELLPTLFDRPEFRRNGSMTFRREENVAPKPRFAQVA